MEKHYCSKCDKLVNYEVKEEMISSKIKGKKIEFKGSSAYCSECGEYIFVDENEDENIILAREEFLRRNK